MILPSTDSKASLFSLPVDLDAAMPSPNSTAFTAPIEKSAFPICASSLSKTGSPKPTGKPVAVQITDPPAESLSSLQFSRY